MPVRLAPRQPEARTHLGRARDIGDKREDHDLHTEQTDHLPGEPCLEFSEPLIEIVACDQTGSRIVDLLAKRFGGKYLRCTLWFALLRSHQ
jgi:hypothetical protein